MLASLKKKPNSSAGGTHISSVTQQSNSPTPTSQLNPPITRLQKQATTNLILGQGAAQKNHLSHLLPAIQSDPVQERLLENRLDPIADLICHSRAFAALVWTTTIASVMLVIALNGLNSILTKQPENYGLADVSVFRYYVLVWGVPAFCGLLLLELVCGFIRSHILR